MTAWKKFTARLQRLRVSTRNVVSDNGWRFSPVDDFSIFRDFDCSDDDLNDFIRNDAAPHQSGLIAATYSLTFLEFPRHPIAFASLLNDSIKLSGQQRKIVENQLRRYPEYPAVKIGRLGVRDEFQHQGMGTIVINIIKMLFRRHNRTGCRFITVDAYNNPQTISFYTRNDFKHLPGEHAKAASETILMFFDLLRLVPR